jgi:ubiquinone/menaquinone biosynthesis C-methylase UbiE
MHLWIVAVTLFILVFGLIFYWRIPIKRDTSREKKDDHESIQAYDRINGGPFFGLIRYFVIRQLEKYRPQETLIDAGCGPGYLAFAIARKFPQLKITGIDISGEMVKIAEINSDRLKFNSRVQFLKADVQRLPLASNSIDFAISTLSLHHWSNPGQAMGEFHRVLKPEGQILIFDLRRDAPVILFILAYIVQNLFAPSPIRKTNGAVGSIWSSFIPEEAKILISQSPFQSWKVQPGWSWNYIWGKK